MIGTKAAARDLSDIILRTGTSEKIVFLGPMPESLKPALEGRLAFFQDSDLDRADLPYIEGTVVISDALSGLKDIWTFFRKLRLKLGPEARCILIHTAWYWEQLADFTLGRPGKPANSSKSWLSDSDIKNLLALNGFEVVSSEERLLFPWSLPVIDFLCNRVLVKFPLVQLGAMRRAYFIRQDRAWKDLSSVADGPSVSIVVPCKDERGNIRRCIEETPKLGRKTEILFVEGGSKDGTREEIENWILHYKGPLELRLLKQERADGKGGAVRVGFENARNDLLMILDADLTVMPEELPKFYLALVEGRGEFIMGSRLVYPLEKQAMRTLNILGNRFFSYLFTWLLNRPIKDTLCGTKVLRKTDYDRISANRERFGFYDPFGDYDLIFGAALQNLKIIEIPIRYQARIYGETKIHRFSHGWLLFKMCGVAFRRFKLR